MDPAPDSPILAKPTTADLQAEALRQQARVQTFDPREIRLSEAGQCGRRQTLRALGYQPAPHTLRELAIFETGHFIEDRLAAYWEARYPGGVNRQIQVVSPYGTGHIDLYIAPLNHIVECKTTTEKQRERLPLASHLAQVTLYLHFWGHARGATAEIVYYLKETGETVSFPVSYDPAYAQELVLGLMEVQAAITFLKEPLDVPEDYEATRYPCAWHTPDGLARCRFWQYCWGSRIVTRPESSKPGSATVAEAPMLQADAAAYARLRQQLAALAQHEKVLKAQREAFEAGFARILAEHQADALRAGPFTLKRTVVAGRVTYDVAAAVEAGVVTDAALAPFRKVGEPWTKWTVREHPSPPVGSDR